MGAVLMSPVFLIFISLLLVSACLARDMKRKATRLTETQHPHLFRTSNWQQHPKRVLVRWRDYDTRPLSFNIGHKVSEKDNRLTRFPVSRLDAPHDGNAQSLLEDLMANTHVEVAEPDYMAFSLGGTTSFQPNDLYYDNLWHLHAIDAATAWKISQGSKTVKICVVDSGIDADHEDLRENINRPGFDALQDQATLHDSNGHGTACAGILGAIANNKRGVSGIMWNTNILGCRFLDSDGHGYISDAIQCMQWCVENEARVINHSWGTYAYSKSLRDSMEYLSQQYGVLYVAAAGNEALDNDGDMPMYPASFNLSSILSVAATNRSGSLAPFSNYGEYSVDIAAPGVDIFSTVPYNSYSWFSGTSMAAPLISGTIGLIMSLATEILSPEQLKHIVLESASFNPSLQGKVTNGRFLNVSRAVSKARHQFWQPSVDTNSTIQGMLTHLRPLSIRELPFKSKTYNILDNQSVHFPFGPEIEAFCPESRYPRYNFKSYLTDTLIPKHWFLLERGNISHATLTIDTCTQPEGPWDSLLIILDCDALFKSCTCRADNDGCGKRQRGSKIRLKTQPNRHYAAIVMPGDPLDGGTYKISVRS